MTPNPAARGRSAKKPAAAHGPAKAPSIAASLVRSAALPWFPFISAGVHLKLCRASLATGEMVFMIRLDPGASVGMHYHHGVVVSYTLKGRWRYRGTTWEASAGDVVIQPAGSSHALENAGDGPAEAFVHMSGPLEFQDESGKTICIENAETLHGRYLAYCALHGLERAEVASR
jgi:quercetin dioxygenase-like cupin family protein